jgi:hypothetical protein
MLGSRTARTQRRRGGAVLRFDGERERLVLTDVVALPETLEQVEAELATQRVLDHFAVTLASASAANLHRPQYVLVDRQRRPHLRHNNIMASR